MFPPRSRSFEAPPPGTKGPLKRTRCLLVLPTLLCACTSAPDPAPAPEASLATGSAPTASLTARTGHVIGVWIDEVWHQGRLDLVDSLVAPTYTRHEQDSTYTVSRAQYAEQIRELRARFPALWYEVHDSASVGDRFWIRYTFRGGPDSTGPWPSRPGLQVYRLEGGRLAETWMLLRPPWSEWDDTLPAATPPWP